MTPVLGALEFARLSPGRTARQVLADTVTLTAELERWGYSRVWLSEHHTPNVAHASPDTLLGVVAARTSTIAVGCGGVLLRLHEPARIARAFLLLEALFPGRIDLGCARAGQALEQPFNDEDEDYAARARALLQHLEHRSRVHINPTGVVPPRIWMLGSGETSARLAAALGLRYCHSAFLASTRWHEAIRAYRSSFVPSPHCRVPYVGVAAAGVCAESDARAAGMVADYGPGPEARVVGGPNTCRDMALELSYAVDADEFLFLDMSTSFSAKRDSYQGFASAMLATGTRLANS